MPLYIRRFREITIHDTTEVGGKNSSLGEMFGRLSDRGIKVPDGFATTAEAFWNYLDHNSLRKKLQGLMQDLDRANFSNLHETGKKARELIISGNFPEQLSTQIKTAYNDLCDNTDREVAVRSSATAEDLPEASFAGQHESYLNVKGADNVLQKVKQCYASLYTDRAIKYREDNKFDHDKIALSAGVQKMVRSDKACSGIGFTLEPESGFRNIIHLSGVWGLGENIVQGIVTPDEFYVFKPTLALDKNAIVQKKKGTKEKTLIYDHSGTVNITTPEFLQRQWVLNDKEIMQLARWAAIIEEHYNKCMDIEWAKDGETNELFIIQARPETVHSREKKLQITEYHIKQKGSALVSGQAIGNKMAKGRARILQSPLDGNKLQNGEIVVTEITSPDWDPLLKKAGGIITDKGGRTSHASIVARELGVPAIVGTGEGTKKIIDGSIITLSCCEGATGFVYEGALDYEEEEIDVTDIKLPESTEAMMIVADPDSIFKLAAYPNDGVGLMRLEFIITHRVKVHPMAIVNFDKLEDAKLKNEINVITEGYEDKKQFMTDQLAQGVATIASAFYPKDVIVRMSDFKSNEYANLVGGKLFEPKEENPMLGFRGASRYYSPLYKDGFRLECEAMKVVRSEMGFTNVKLMIPFCRTPEEGRKVIEVMKEFGLDRSADDSLEIYVMAEIPSNVLQAEEFAEIFDGFSIGSNDLTQLTLGIDRDSALVADLFSEQNRSAMEMIAMVIQKAKSLGMKIGLCGQAPSDLPDFASFLVSKGIDSISFNPDSIIRGINNINKAEEALYLQA